MSWQTVRGTVLEEGMLQKGMIVIRTLLVESENGERLVIAPKDEVLNKLARGDVIEFETEKGKEAKITSFLGRIKRNCRNLRIIS